MIIITIIICLKRDMDIKLSLITSCALLGTVGWGRRLKCSFLISLSGRWVAQDPTKPPSSETERTKRPEWTRGSGMVGDGPTGQQQLQTTALTSRSQEELEDAATASLAFGFLLSLHYIPGSTSALLPWQKQVTFWQKHVCLSSSYLIVTFWQ